MRQTVDKVPVVTMGSVLSGGDRHYTKKQTAYFPETGRAINKESWVQRDG